MALPDKSRVATRSFPLMFGSRRQSKAQKTPQKQAEETNEMQETQKEPDVPHPRPITRLLEQLGFGAQAGKARVHEFNNARRSYMADCMLRNEIGWDMQKGSELNRKLATDFLIKKGYGPIFWPDRPSAANAKKYRFSRHSAKLTELMMQLFYEQLQNRRKGKNKKRRKNLYRKGDTADMPINLVSDDELEYNYPDFEEPPSDSALSPKREPRSPPALPPMEDVQPTEEPQVPVECFPSRHLHRDEPSARAPAARYLEHQSTWPFLSTPEPSQIKRSATSQPEASARKSKTPRASSYLDPSFGPFSHDVNARFDTIDSQDRIAQPTPVPITSMAADAASNDDAYDGPTEVDRRSRERSTETPSPRRYHNSVRSETDVQSEIVCGLPFIQEGNEPEDSTLTTSTVPEEITAPVTQLILTHPSPKPVKEISPHLTEKAETKASPPAEPLKLVVPKTDDDVDIGYNATAARQFLSTHLRGHAKATVTPIMFSFSIHLTNDGDRLKLSPFDFFEMTLKKFMMILPLENKDTVTGLCIRQYGPKFCIRQVFLYNEDVFGNIREQFLRYIESDTKEPKNHGKRLDYEISIEPLRD
ncbi:hypothetical protein F53441_7281 [Fusarium austroafricanum]|uniref:Uncharacterized protein n=1 Tax=Fusarium austroafricanum TaxID=2364996 RepID=A0A8H4KGS4_9HYPO|nr:hypothetical protein F53441_7281 [Fusarium austroafricanum]